MKFYKIFLVFFIITHFSSVSQIMITEVHFDTPYDEENYRERQHHHIGEYIELYNFSDKDIPLKGWAITDYIGKYEFPENTVIASGDFLIIAYREEQLSTVQPIPNLPTNYFQAIFPNTVGQENKILYQDRIILRNAYETLRLHIGYIDGAYCNLFKVEQKLVGKYGSSYNLIFSSDATENPQLYDFYSSVSTHFNPDGSSYDSNPTPLMADNLPPIQDFETINTVLNALEENYNNITWEKYSDELLYNTCPLVITTVEQMPSDTYFTDGVCFNYDNSGNTITVLDCDPDDETPVSSSEYTASELDEINSKIILYPNPTYSTITISWDSTINGKISQTQTSNSSGINLTDETITPTQTGTSIDLTIYSSGIYIVKFVLDSGQFISRNVIKL